MSVYSYRNGGTIGGILWKLFYNGRGVGAYRLFAYRRFAKWVFLQQNRFLRKRDFAEFGWWWNFHFLWWIDRTFSAHWCQPTRLSSLLNGGNKWSTLSKNKGNLQLFYYWSIEEESASVVWVLTSPMQMIHLPKCINIPVTCAWWTNWMNWFMLFLSSSLSDVTNQNSVNTFIFIGRLFMMRWRK